MNYTIFIYIYCFILISNIPNFQSSKITKHEKLRFFFQKIHKREIKRMNFIFKVFGLVGFDWRRMIRMIQRIYVYYLFILYFIGYLNSDYDPNSFQIRIFRIIKLHRSPFFSEYFFNDAFDSLFENVIINQMAY